MINYLLLKYKILIGSERKMFDYFYSIIECESFMTFITKKINNFTFCRRFSMVKFKELTTA